MVTRRPCLLSHLGVLDAFRSLHACPGGLHHGHLGVRARGFAPRYRDRSRSLRRHGRSADLCIRCRNDHRRADDGCLRPPLAVTAHAARLPVRVRELPRRRSSHACARESSGASPVDPPVRYDDRDSGTTIATIAGVPAGALLGTAMGWRTTFWAIALLCIPGAVGVLRGVADKPGQTTTDADSPKLVAELHQLGLPRLVLAMTLGAIVNGGTFAAFTFLAPVVTETAGLGKDGPLCRVRRADDERFLRDRRAEHRSRCRTCSRCVRPSRPGSDPSPPCG